MENEVIKTIAENWELCFLYGIKILNDISKSLSDLKTMVKVHEVEIQNLKEKHV